MVLGADGMNSVCDDPDCARLIKVVESPAFKELIEKVKNRDIENHNTFSTVQESNLWVNTLI